MQKNLPKISVITVCLNAAGTIGETISSVFSQRYDSLEYIVMDGGSVDGTVELFDTCQRENKLTFISEPDKGIYDAMNKAIKIATGEWLFFLGSDDVFLDDEVLLRVFSRTYNNEEIIYGNVKFLHSGVIHDGPFDFEKISFKNICQQSIFYRRNIFDKMGLFNLKYKIYADHEFNIRWMGARLSSLYVDETIVLYNEKGISGRIIDEVFFNEFDDLLINNNIISSRSFNTLKKRHLLLVNSYKYKIGKSVVAPFVWLQSKFYHL